MLERLPTGPGGTARPAGLRGPGRACLPSPRGEVRPAGPRAVGPPPGGDVVVDVATAFRRFVATCSGTVAAAFLPAALGPVPTQGPQVGCYLVVTETTLEAQRARLARESEILYARLGYHREAGHTVAVLTTGAVAEALRTPKLARWCRYAAWEGITEQAPDLAAATALLRALLGPAVVLAGRPFLVGQAGVASAVVRAASTGSGREGTRRLARALGVPEMHVSGPPPLAIA